MSPISRKCSAARTRAAAPGRYRWSARATDQFPNTFATSSPDAAQRDALASWCAAGPGLIGFSREPWIPALRSSVLDDVLRIARNAAPRPGHERSLHRRDLDVGRPENDDEQAGQEEQDHRHGEFRRQCRGLLFGLVHPHVAIFLRHHPQALPERGAVTFRLLQSKANRFHAVEAGALGEVLIGGLAI